MIVGREGEKYGVEIFLERAVGGVIAFVGASFVKKGWLRNCGKHQLCEKEGEEEQRLSQIEAFHFSVKIY